MKGRIFFASHALVVGPVLAAAAMLLQPVPARAGTSATDAYRTECGDCHLAFPPSLLRPADWATVLANLDRHYGVDATLDDASRSAVARQLRADVAAAHRVPASQALPRITRSPWFREEHDEVTPRTWSSSRVQSASNCAACHPAAQRGEFDEHSAHIHE